MDWKHEHIACLIANQMGVSYAECITGHRSWDHSNARAVIGYTLNICLGNTMKETIKAIGVKCSMTVYIASRNLRAGQYDEFVPGGDAQAYARKMAELASEVEA